MNTVVGWDIGEDGKDYSCFIWGRWVDGVLHISHVGLFKEGVRVDVQM